MNKPLTFAAVALAVVACSAVAQEPSQADAVAALKGMAEPNDLRTVADVLDASAFDGDALRAVADAVEADEFDAETLLAACPWCLGEIFELLACDGLTGAGGFDTSCQAAYDQCVAQARGMRQFGNDSKDKRIGNPDYADVRLEADILSCGRTYDRCMSRKGDQSLLCQIFLPFAPPPSAPAPPRLNNAPAPAE